MKLAAAGIAKAGSSLVNQCRWLSRWACTLKCRYMAILLLWSKKSAPLHSGAHFPYISQYTLQLAYCPCAYIRSGSKSMVIDPWASAICLESHCSCREMSPRREHWEQSLDPLQRRRYWTRSRLRGTKQCPHNTQVPLRAFWDYTRFFIRPLHSWRKSQQHEFAGSLCALPGVERFLARILPFRCQFYAGCPPPPVRWFLSPYPRVIQLIYLCQVCTITLP